MKFGANGAVTVCIVDLANVEIADLVGEKNIYTFGASSDEVKSLRVQGLAKHRVLRNLRLNRLLIS